MAEEPYSARLASPYVAMGFVAECAFSTLQCHGRVTSQYSRRCDQRAEKLHPRTLNRSPKLLYKRVLPRPGCSPLWLCVANRHGEPLQEHTNDATDTAASSSGGDQQLNAGAAPASSGTSVNAASKSIEGEDYDGPTNKGLLQNLAYRVTSTLRPSPVDREIAQLSVPALGALALDPLVALADTAFLGRLGALSLSGVGISNNVFNLAFTCFNFLVMVTTPQIAAAFGRGDRERASRTIATALWIAVIVGSLAVVILGAFTAPVVAFFGANAATIPYAKNYLRARIVAAPFFLSIMACQAAFRGYQDTRTPFAVGIVADVVNLGLFPLLIFVLDMGVIGAGLATAAGQITLATGLFVLMVRKGLVRLDDLRRPPQLNDVLPLLKTGVVLSLRTLSIMSAVSMATATAAMMGTVQGAAFEIGRQIWTLFSRLLDSMSVAAQSLVPVNLGRGDYQKARQTSSRLMQIGFFLGCVFSGLLLLSSGFLSRLFTSDAAVSHMLRSCFPVMAYTMPINALVFVLDGIYTGGRRFNFLTFAVVLANICAMIALTAIRRIGLPLSSVWAALNLMMCIRAFLLFSYYKSPRSPVPKRPNEVVD